MAGWIFLGLRLFESQQDFVADRHCIRETFQPWSKLRKFVVTEVAVSNAGG